MKVQKLLSLQQIYQTQGLLPSFLWITAMLLAGSGLFGR